MKFLPVDEQLKLIGRGTEEIIPLADLKSKLERSRKTGEPLKVKLGCDPSRPDLHIGHGVVLRKLRHFQDLGHQAILVIGDFTAMIGDPSGRNKTRPQLTIEETHKNAESYVKQAQAILDIDRLKIVYNNDWLGKMNFSEVVRLASHYTVARMIERDDFTKRFQGEIPISIHEFLYPLAQGMDSVELGADVELGGTDQKFNLLVGRHLQREDSLEPQVIITTPLLEGTDGVEKMSKSYDNHIGLQASPDEIYGRTLSIPDNLILKYYRLAADADDESLAEIEAQLSDATVNPRDVKRRLARTLVTMYHDDRAAKAAQEQFDRIFIAKSAPDDMPEYHLEQEEALVELIAGQGLADSNSAAKRLIKQGAVKLDGEPLKDFQFKVAAGTTGVLKVGKRRFLKLI